MLYVYLNLFIFTQAHICVHSNSFVAAISLATTIYFTSRILKNQAPDLVFPSSSDIK